MLIKLLDEGFLTEVVVLLVKLIRTRVEIILFLGLLVRLLLGRLRRCCANI